MKVKLFTQPPLFTIQASSLNSLFILHFLWSPLRQAAHQQRLSAHSLSDSSSDSPRAFSGRTAVPLIGVTPRRRRKSRQRAKQGKRSLRSLPALRAERKRAFLRRTVLWLRIRQPEAVSRSQALIQKR